MSRLWVLALAIVAVACATAEDVADEGNGGEAGMGTGGVAGLTAAGGSWATGGGNFGGTGFGGSSSSGGSGASGGAGGSGATSSGGGSGGTGAGGTGGSGGSSATGGTGSGGTSGTGGTSCAATNLCASATNLGMVSGDSGSDTQSKSASGSMWLQIRVTEDNNSVVGQALTLQATLDVPNGSDYDLYAYLNTTSDSSPCGLSPAKKSDAGGIGSNEQVKLDWGEGLIANGSDDSRTVVIEVRHKGGTCGQWSLIAAGDV